MEKEDSSGITISCLVSFLYFVVRLASDWRKNRQNTKKEERKYNEGGDVVTCGWMNQLKASDTFAGIKKRKLEREFNH